MSYLYPTDCQTPPVESLVDRKKGKTMTNTFYSISGFDYGCVTGGHNVTPQNVEWRTTIGGKRVGVQTCPDCKATRKVMEYAKRKR